MQSDVLKHITSLGATAAMINKLATGEVTFNTGTFAIENTEAIALLTCLMLERIDLLILLNETS